MSSQTIDTHYQYCFVTAFSFGTTVLVGAWIRFWGASLSLRAVWMSREWITAHFCEILGFNLEFQVFDMSSLIVDHLEVEAIGV